MILYGIISLGRIALIVEQSNRRTKDDIVRADIIKLIKATPFRRDIQALEEPQFFFGRYRGAARGDRLKIIYEQNPSQFIPSPELANQLLYFGQGNYFGLSKFVKERIARLGNPYLMEDPPLKGGIGTYNILRLLDFLEGAYQQESSRLTGEPAFAHILRVVSMGVDFILMNYRDRLNGRQNIYFTTETAELFLIICALHDFTEPTITVDSQNGRYNKRLNGAVDFSYSTLDGRNDLNQSPNIRVSTITQEGGKVTVRDSIQLDGIPLRDVPFIHTALLGLDSSSVPSNEVIRHIIASNKNTHQVAGWWESMLRLIPYIVKAIDRIDNQNTRLFKSDGNGGFQPRSVEGIYEKAWETLTTFGPVENVLATINYPLRPVRISRLYMPYQNPEMCSWFPTRWARWILLGVPTNQLYIPELFVSIPVMI